MDSVTLSRHSDPGFSTMMQHSTMRSHPGAGITPEHRPMRKSHSLPMHLRKPKRGVLKVTTLNESLHSTWESSNQTPKNVDWKEIRVREFDRTVGDNPSCSSGPPLTIGWNYADQPRRTVDWYEKERPPRKSQFEMVLPREERTDLLIHDWRVSQQLIANAIRANIKAKNQRRRTVNNLGRFSKVEEMIESAKRKAYRMVTLQKRTSRQIDEMNRKAARVDAEKQQYWHRLEASGQVAYIEPEEQEDDELVMGVGGGPGPTSPPNAPNVIPTSPPSVNGGGSVSHNSGPNGEDRSHVSIEESSQPDAIQSAAQRRHEQYGGPKIPPSSNSGMQQQQQQQMNQSRSPNNQQRYPGQQQQQQRYGNQPQQQQQRYQGRQQQYQGGRYSNQTYQGGGGGAAGPTAAAAANRGQYGNQQYRNQQQRYQGGGQYGNRYQTGQYQYGKQFQTGQQQQQQWYGQQQQQQRSNAYQQQQQFSRTNGNMGNSRGTNGSLDGRMSGGVASPRMDAASPVRMGAASPRMRQQQQMQSHDQQQTQNVEVTEGEFNAFGLDYGGQ